MGSASALLWLCALAAAGAGRSSGARASALPGAGQQPPRMSSSSSSPPGARGGNTPRLEDPPLPVAYNPTLTVRSLAAAGPAKAPAAASFQLTPAGCGGAACTGFRLSNAAGFPADRTNAAAFAPAARPVMVDPFNPQTYELGTLTLTNGGLALPADAGAALVPVTADLLVATEGTGKSTPLSVTFLVSWSPGTPAPPNNAGLFVLVTKASGATPPPARSFSVAMAPGVDFSMRLELLGFVPDAGRGAGVTLLGDWGQPAPAAGQPGPRAYVKLGGGPQVVKLVARISKVA